MEERRIPFSKEDEEKIASAALWGMIAAITSISSSVITLGIVISFGVSAFGQLIGVGISVMLGVWLYQASAAFRKVALTDVADQHYLMEGFRKLRAYFMTLGILFIVGLSLGILAILGATMCAAQMRF